MSLPCVFYMLFLSLSLFLFLFCIYTAGLLLCICSWQHASGRFGQTGGWREGDRGTLLSFFYPSNTHTTYHHHLPLPPPRLPTPPHTFTVPSAMPACYTHTHFSLPTTCLPNTTIPLPTTRYFVFTTFPTFPACSLPHAAALLPLHYCTCTPPAHLLTCSTTSPPLPCLYTLPPHFSTCKIEKYGLGHGQEKACSLPFLC